MNITHDDDNFNTNKHPECIKKQAEIVNLRDRLTQMSNKIYELEQQNLILIKEIKQFKKR